jgi:hypothetical protein
MVLVPAELELVEHGDSLEGRADGARRRRVDKREAWGTPHEAAPPQPCA